MSAYPAYTYSAKLAKSDASIHDGDTLHATVDLGCDVNINLTLRLYGINAPELNTAEGKAAKAWVLNWFAINCPHDAFILRTIKDSHEKYGRYLGVVVPVGSDASLNDAMVTAGHAVRYLPK